MQYARLDNLVVDGRSLADDVVCDWWAGTLTCNKMEFFKCSIAGVKYGRGVTDIERTMAARAGKVLCEEPRSGSAVRELGFNFDDPCARRALMRSGTNATTPALPSGS